jgi:hypothetical protein
LESKISTNLYFNNFPLEQITSEQLLVEDLVIESMQIHGMDVYYLPRTVRSGNEVDYLYGEDTLKEYLTAYPIEMYLENVTGMEGEGEFISKFGLEIREEMTLLVSRRRFKYTTGLSNLLNPREGDLIYVPLVQNFFEITFVEHENDQAMFHTLGRGRGGNVYVYALKLKQFVFSNENISTGVDEVDEQIRHNYTRSQLSMSLSIGTGTYSNDEIVFQSTDGTLANATAKANVHSWSKTVASRKLDVYRVIGTFANASNTIGVTSGAYYTTAGTINNDVFDNNAFEDIIDNTRIQTEANSIIDFTEINPFGEP